MSSTIKIDDNFHWKALQLYGANWTCVVCEAPYAVTNVTYFDHLGRTRFRLRYCRHCLPPDLVEPPLDLRLRTKNLIGPI
jgi:hypothetical protein